MGAIDLQPIDRKRADMGGFDGVTGNFGGVEGDGRVARDGVGIADWRGRYPLRSSAGRRSRDAVRATRPVPDIASSAARSLASASVGLPPAPLPFETLMPAAGPVSVRRAKVSAAVSTRMPAVESSAASAVSVASSGCFPACSSSSAPLTLVAARPDAALS